MSNSEFMVLDVAFNVPTRNLVIPNGVSAEGRKLCRPEKKEVRSLARLSLYDSRTGDCVVYKALPGTSIEEQVKAIASTFVTLDVWCWSAGNRALNLALADCGVGADNGNKLRDPMAEYMRPVLSEEEFERKRHAREAWLEGVEGPVEAIELNGCGNYTPRDNISLLVALYSLRGQYLFNALRDEMRIIDELKMHVASGSDLMAPQRIIDSTMAQNTQSTATFVQRGMEAALVHPSLKTPSVGFTGCKKKRETPVTYML